MEIVKIDESKLTKMEGERIEEGGMKVDDQQIFLTDCATFM